MARARLLKPGFFKNEELARLSPLHRLLFAGLWTLADREGRLEDRPERIKVELFPYETDISSATVDAMCSELHIGAFILRYGVRGGVDRVTRYIALPTFLEHQTPHHREPASRIPPPSSRLVRSRQKSVIPAPVSPRAKPRAQPDPSLTDPVTGDPVPVTGDPETETVPRATRANGGGGAAHSGERNSKHPVFKGRRIVVFEWMLADLMQLLGPHADAFGPLNAWLVNLDAAVDRVLPATRDERWQWLQTELVTEAGRRGLPIAAGNRNGDATDSDAVWKSIAKAGPAR
jgi:hypothetical protein